MSLFEEIDNAAPPVSEDVMYVEQHVDWDIPQPDGAAILHAIRRYAPERAKEPGIIISNFELRGLHEGRYWFATKLHHLKSDRRTWIYVQVPQDVIRSLPRYEE